MSMVTKSRERSEFKEALRYLGHVLIARALFTFLILAVVGIEILLSIIKESQYASDFLFQTLIIGKYAILIIDLGLLIYLLASRTYARPLPWK
uniref:Phosphate-starvation-inducible E n=1 Tax=Candidatus Kentrum sp. FW TaxID=2126338 RepID=A0A450TIU5_9GAMM|nr:MAG: hypothetical protein BECKFW1821C_GA0114237_101139 [Candidatus Kentron sp. FW]